VLRAPSLRSVLAASAALAALALTTPTLTGCGRGNAAEAKEKDAKPGPPQVTDASANLLLTWIDDAGEFHVEQKVSGVPESGRALVRVVDPDKGAPPDVVYLVDLRAPASGGGYAVRTAPRDEFEKVAATRRAAKGGKVLADALPSASAPAPATSGEADLVDRPDVIIYGAEWCGPCHQAEAYMKKRGISYVEKDIEKDSGAQREMRAKLSKSGMRGGSIPVIDVKGKLLLGFDAGAVERALRM
jgi:glutaredoxin